MKRIIKTMLVLISLMVVLFCFTNVYAVENIDTRNFSTKGEIDTSNAAHSVQSIIMNLIMGVEVLLLILSLLLFIEMIVICKTGKSDMMWMKVMNIILAVIGLLISYGFLAIPVAVKLCSNKNKTKIVMNIIMMILLLFVVLIINEVSFHPALIAE